MAEESWFRREFLKPRRLVFNVLFYGLHLFFFEYGWYLQVRGYLSYPPFKTHKKQYTDVRLSGINSLNSLKYSVWISRGAGLVLAFDGGLILIPMLRNVLRFLCPKLRWLFSADENIWFHRQVAYSMAFWTMVHTTAHYVNFINVERTRTFFL